MHWQRNILEATIHKLYCFSVYFICNIYLLTCCIYLYVIYLSVHTTLAFILYQISLNLLLVNDLVLVEMPTSPAFLSQWISPNQITVICDSWYNHIFSPQKLPSLLVKCAEICLYRKLLALGHRCGRPSFTNARLSMELFLGCFSSQTDCSPVSACFAKLTELIFSTTSGQIGQHV